MHLTYDPAADAAYLSLRELLPGERLGPTPLLEVDREFAGTVALDFSLTTGEAVGIEFLDASRCLPAAFLATAYRLDIPYEPRQEAGRAGPHVDVEAWAQGGRRRPMH